MAGIGKSALIEKLIEKIQNGAGKKSIIQITATKGMYPGWLSDRLTLKVYQQIETNKKLLDKIKNWFNKNGPDLLKTIKGIVETSSKALGNQITFPSISIPTNSTEKVSKSDFAVLTLIDQFTKQADRELYIIIEDAHLLPEIDKNFLADLMSNHSNKAHVLLSRRPQEKNTSLFSSPEISYLMKDNRIVEIKGLDIVATELLVKAYGITYELEVLKQITEQLGGNPYFLNLFLSSAKRNSGSLSGSAFVKLSEQNASNLDKYLQSQYIENFSEFYTILNASSVLPSNIHAEVLSQILTDPDCQAINEKLLELERRVYNRKMKPLAVIGFFIRCLHYISIHS